MKRLYIACLAMLLASPALGQGAIVQSGPVTQFHPPSFLQNGIVMDGGWPNSPFLDGVGLFNGGTCPFGVSSQTNPGAPPAQYSLFSICQTNSTTTLNIQSFGGLPAPILQFVINGVVYTFPQNNPTSPPVVITSGSSYSPTALSTTILWKSPTALQKTQNLPICNSTNVGVEFAVSDDKGTAGTYPIYILPTGSDTILNHALYSINFDNGEITVMCDGLGNWAASK